MNDDGTVSVPLSWSERHAEVRAERDRLRAALESIAIPPVHIPGVSEGCEGCAGVARAALDGVDFSGPVSIALEDVDAVAERDRLRAVVEAVRPYMTILPVDVAEGLTSIEPIDYIDQERDRMRTALADISRVVMPDIGHGGNYGFVVASAEAIAAERDRLQAAVENLRAVVQGYEDEMSHIAFAVADGRGAVHHDDILGLVRGMATERDRLRESVARYKEFAESEILDRVSAELGVDLRRQLEEGT